MLWEYAVIESPEINGDLHDIPKPGKVTVLDRMRFAQQLDSWNSKLTLFPGTLDDTSYIRYVRAVVNEYTRAVQQFMKDAANGNVDRVCHAVEKGVVDMDVHDPKRGLLTALMWASSQNQIEVVKWLISKGANVEAEDEFGGTALFAAVKGGLAVEPRLSNADCNVTNVTEFIHLQGNISIVEYLVVTGHANVEAKDKHGRTALMFASFQGQLTIVQCLISQGRANVDAKDKNGRTALMYASKEVPGQLQVVQYLVSVANANLEATDIDLGTAMHYAVNSIGPMVKYKVTKWLAKSAMAHVFAKDCTGITPVDIARKLH